MHRPAAPELLSPLPYVPDSPRGLKLKIAVVLFMLAAGLALSYYGHTLLRETASKWLLLIYLSAAALPAGALLDLWRYRWQWLAQRRAMASPLACQLPPRRPARRSLRFTTNSALNQFIRLLILGAMLAALATGLGAGELREKLLLLVLVLGLMGIVPAPMFGAGSAGATMPSGTRSTATGAAGSTGRRNGAGRRRTFAASIWTGPTTTPSCGWRAGPAVPMCHC